MGEATGAGGRSSSVWRLFFLTLPFLHTRAHAPPPPHTHTWTSFIFHYQFLDKAFDRRLLPDPAAHDKGAITERPAKVAVGMTLGETGERSRDARVIGGDGPGGGLWPWKAQVS